MTTAQKYNGRLISELGVKRYLKAQQNISTSNVDYLIRPAAAEKAWKECNFGCHGPSYRALKRHSTYAERLAPIDDFSPLLAGVADGLHHQTIAQAKLIGAGIRRTGEGLHLDGAENFSHIADENLAAYNFAETTLENIISFDLGTLDNPITQSVMLVVNEYMALLPEWLIQDCLKENALRLPENIDTAWPLKSSSLGLIKDVSSDHLQQAAALLNNPAQRIVGKQIGKSVAAAMAAALASAVTKKLLRESVEVKVLKRKLARIRVAAKKANGGLGKALLLLLKSQGLLDSAAQSSRKLQGSCPRIWRILRYDMNSANMAYFLLENMVSEYVDRIALLQANPREFAKVMAALIRDKQAPKIFFPDFRR